MDVRETLGYAASDHFVSSEQIDQLAGSELAFALRLALKECSQLGE